MFICHMPEPLLVSIHAPREGCDTGVVPSELFGTVSIHAPREGCDLQIDSTKRPRRSFNSRTPGGVRQVLVIRLLMLICSFNSRTPGGVRLVFPSW